MKRNTELDMFNMPRQCWKWKNKYYVRVDLHGVPVNLLKEHFPIVSIDKGGDGVYTYIFDKKKTLYTAKVRNTYELGSLHMNIVYTNKIQTILAAGELHRKGNAIEFNLLSGTYMKLWMTETLKGQCDKEVQTQTEELFKQAGWSDTTYTTESLIRPATIPLDVKHLDEFVDIGASVMLFEDKQLCNKDARILDVMIKHSTIASVKKQLIAELDDLQSKTIHYTKGMSVGGRRRRTTKRQRKQSRRKIRQNV